MVRSRSARRPDGGPIEVLGQCGGPLDSAFAPSGELYITRNTGDPDVFASDHFEIAKLDIPTNVLTVVFTFDRLISNVRVAPNGRILFGARDSAPDVNGQFPMRIHQVTGPASSIPVPGTVDLGQSDFAVDEQGTIFAAGTGPSAHRVYAVASDGTRTLVAGTGVSGFKGDGGPATSARLSFPAGVDVNEWGWIYIADQGNHRIRRIDQVGTIKTVAGGGKSTEDGGLAIDAKLKGPIDVAIDMGTEFWLADADNQFVRFVGRQ